MTYLNQTSRPVVVIIGGFLAAGKTTLILTAAEMLQSQGLRAAAIFNDQGTELVDTHFARQTGIGTSQVTGGCFCCRFSDLIAAANTLREHSPDVIFAEAVGSCTDISATVLQPLKLRFSGGFQVAPYTVLVDPVTARELSAEGADPELSFLFHKQTAEADLICFNKTDLDPASTPIDTGRTRFISAATGDGVPAWLTEVLSGQIEAGGTILDIDYEKYAKAEAKLAWLNCSFTYTPHHALSPSVVVGPFLQTLDAAFTANRFHIAHLKVIDECETGYIKAAIARNGDEPAVQGNLSASQCRNHQILLNVRLAGCPEQVEHIVREQLFQLAGSVEIRAMQCFSPAPPTPQYRYSSTVKNPDLTSSPST